MLRVVSARFSHSYSPIIKRNRVPFVDFITGAPKSDPSTVAAVAEVTGTSQVYTVSKQAQVMRSLEDAGGKLRIFKGRVIPQLSVPRVSHSGRNQTGTITTRHQGGGNKNRLRLIDYKRARKDIPATVLRVEYCPKRTSHVALIQYTDGVMSYIVAPLALRAGHTVIASERAPISAGNCLPHRAAILALGGRLQLSPSVGSPSVGALAALELALGGRCRCSAAC